MASDDELIRAARAGSHDAFGTLVERYRDGLYRFLLVRCARSCDAEDTLQETFSAAWRYLDSYDSRWRFSTWLYRIALRRAAAMPSAFEALADEPWDHTADPLADCIADDDKRNIWLMARRQLTPDGYMVLWLHYAEDMAVREVARTMGRSVSWVKVNLYRARRRLGRTLATEDRE